MLGGACAKDKLCRKVGSLFCTVTPAPAPVALASGLGPSAASSSRTVSLEMFPASVVREVPSSEETSVSISEESCALTW